MSRNELLLFLIVSVSLIEVSSSVIKEEEGGDFDLDKVGSQRQHGDDLELDNIVDHMVKVVEGYIENLADMMSCSKCSKSGVEVKKQRIKEL
ncbi:hypothetical protein MTP99_004292 [Tenebrio molitor]|nr:hypothetical protein MTP99_004292 [Tenebrio molitor]CAH1380291.1 unnamed protein product [Tenebrio molitor]